MISKLTIAFLAVFLLAGNIFAEDMTPENAKKILEEALEKLAKKTYRTSHTSKKGKSIYITNTYQQHNPDGTIFNRYEAIKNGSIYYLKIKNNAGTFNIIDNIAVKINYRDKQSKIEGLENYIDYSIKNSSINNIPCYIITKRTQPNEAAFQAYIKSFPNSLTRSRTESEMRSIFKEMFPCVEKYYIDKRNGFILSCLYYNQRGRIIQTINYDNVDLNPFLNPNIFKIPKKTKIKGVDSHNKFAEEMTTIVKKKYSKHLRGIKNKPSLLSRTLTNIIHLPSKIVNTCDSNLGAITSVLSTILFWGAMILIFVVIIYKIKQRKA